MSDWFKCKPMPFLEGLETCESTDEALVYVVCIFRMYATDAPIPNNPASIGPFAKMGAAKARRAIAGLLEQGKLKLVDGYLSNEKFESEMGEQRSLSRKRSAAGKEGGRPAKTEQKPATNPQQTGEKSGKVEGLLSVSGEEMAENSQTPKASAFTEREKERKSPPLPPTDHMSKLREEFAEFRKTLPPADPDAAQPADGGDRDRILNRVSNLSRHDGYDVDNEPIVRELTSFIMIEAKMVMPPADLALVSGWIAQGMHPDKIRVIVSRLCANAKQPVRGMRYFDSTIRAELQAESDADAAQIRHFEAIAARHKALNAPTSQH